MLEKKVFAKHTDSSKKTSRSIEVCASDSRLLGSLTEIHPSVLIEGPNQNSQHARGQFKQRIEIKKQLNMEIFL